MAKTVIFQVVIVQILNVYTSNGKVLSVLYNLYEDSNSTTNFKEKSIGKQLQLQQNILLEAINPTLRGKYYADACVTLITHALFLLHLPRTVL